MSLNPVSHFTYVFPNHSFLVWTCYSLASILISSDAVVIVVAVVAVFQLGKRRIHYFWLANRRKKNDLWHFMQYHDDIFSSYNKQQVEQRSNVYIVYYNKDNSLWLWYRLCKIKQGVTVFQSSTPPSAVVIRSEVRKGVGSWNEPPAASCFAIFHFFSFVLFDTWYVIDFHRSKCNLLYTKRTTLVWHNDYCTTLERRWSLQWDEENGTSFHLSLDTGRAVMN